MSENDDCIPWPIIQLAKTACEIYPTVCISGSAPLVKYVRDKAGHPQIPPSETIVKLAKKLKNNDVDIFVALNTQIRLSDYPEHYPRRRATCCRDMKLIERYCQTYGHLVTRREYSNTKNYYCNATIPNGVVLAITIKIEVCIRQGCPRVPLPMLVNVVYVYDVSVLQTSPWPKYVTGTFDVSVARGVIDINIEGHLEGPYFNPDVERQINDGTFVYTIMPGYTFRRIIRRITKYTHKGFRLASIEFNQFCGPAHKEYVWRHFCHTFGPGHLNRLMCGVINPMPAYDVLFEYIREYFDIPSMTRDSYNFFFDVVADSMIRMAKADISIIIARRDSRHMSIHDVRLALNEIILTKIKDASEACMANIIRRWWLRISRDISIPHEHNPY